LENDIERAYGLRSIDPWPLDNGDGSSVQAWLVRYVLADFDPAAFDAWGIPCPQEIRRSVPKRQAEFLFGRLAARQTLRQLGTKVVEIGTGSHRQPLWPPGIMGSISHSRGYAAALALPQARYAGVGLDIEGIAESSALEALLSTVIDESELHRLQAITPSCPLPKLVTLVFSAKESFFKAAFAQVARYFDFQAVQVCEVDLAASRLVLEVREPLAGDLMPGAIRAARFGFLEADTVFTMCLW
jgi:4'-phosphopantetheinyl transferase EntD